MENPSYLSKSSGIGGTLKAEPEHFLVEEIGLDGKAFAIGEKLANVSHEGDFTHLILEKKNWNTSQALKKIAEAVHTGHKRFSCAGTKDRLAISTQLCSVFKISPEKLLSLHIKDISVNGAWKAAAAVEMGDLLGNRFTIKVTGAGENTQERIAAISNELNGRIINYFGEQRFGSARKNTHLVGRDILRNDFKSAVMNYLSFVDEGENEEAKNARKNLAEGNDYKRALAEFPHYLKYERTMLDFLAENPYDYVNAMRKLPRSLALMFVHAFQSQLFNELLSERVKEGEDSFRAEEGEYFCPENSYGFPDIENKIDASGAGAKWLVCKIIGYETQEESLSEREKKILEKYELKISDFKIKSFPEISSKGSRRCFFVPLKNFSFAPSENIFKFELPAGSYATVAMREFLDAKDG